MNVTAIGKRVAKTKASQLLRDLFKELFPTKAATIVMLLLLLSPV